MSKIESKEEKGESGGQAKKLRYPYSVFFIVGNEFCERFSYYGMKSILSLYLKKKLKFTEDKATTIYHTFSCFCYFTPILGAWIADQFLGKFKTIVYISFLYILGHILKTIAAIPTLGVDPYSMSFIGLALIALGTGGIKPCVSAFGGDQFKLPEQERQLQTFFSVFYFSINAGSFISTIVTPILREDVECFGDTTCYSLAFGVPAALMAIALVIIVMGKPLYKMNPPQGNILVKVLSSIGSALGKNVAGKRGETHWMDVSKEEFGEDLVEDVKALLRVLLLYIPVPVWWALFDQTGSRWTFQATRMDGYIGISTIKPDQMQVINPILILLLLPTFDWIIYPLCAKCNFLKKPLQRMCMGGLLCAVSFIVSGILELELQKTYAVIPGENSADLHLMNNINCPVTVNIKAGDNSVMSERIEMLGNKIIHSLEPRSYSLEMSVEESCLADLPQFTVRSSSEQLDLKGGEVAGVLLGVIGGAVKPSVILPPEDPEKDSNANGKLRVVYVPGDVGELISIDNFTLISEEKQYDFNLTGSALTSTNYSSVELGDYMIHLNSDHLDTTEVKAGGVYTLVLARDPQTNMLRPVVHTLTKPNSIHILWQFPQYFIITASEVMFSVTGLEFSYSQAPSSMKSVVQAAWLLTVAFGNIIVILVAEAKLFSDQASEFFMFAGLMVIDTLVFIFLAWRYIPRRQQDSNQSNDIPLKNGLSNTNFKSDSDF